MHPTQIAGPIVLFPRSDPQRAIQFVRSSPGVTSAIVGMRREEHVVENLELAQRGPAPLEVIESLYEDARR